MATVSETRNRVWRPYEDEPLLTRAMADGYDAVPTAELDRLRTYLEALVSARRAPVHVSVAFNAVYFGYDLGGDGYGGSPLDLDAFPVVAFGESAPALPVGAMVHIATGSQPLYAEIVYKEGRHPESGELGDVPDWVSGAPVGAEGPGRPCSENIPERRELLVPDLHVFGDALSPSSAQLGRFRAQRRWIDQNGHVLVNAVYPSGESAERGDVHAYAAHLLATGRAQLLSPTVPMSLAQLAGGRDEERLSHTLSRLLDVVGRVLASSDAVRMWGLYAMSCASLAACWRDEGPLGGDDMGTLAATLRNAARPAVRRRYGLPAPITVHTAIGPRLRHFPGAEPLLKGVGYAAAVCRSNLALADVLRGESENGLFDNGVRVSLDDPFEGGGVWRSRHPGTDEGDDPLQAAGRGWRGTLRSFEPSQDDQPPEPVDLPLPDTAELGPGQLLRIDDTGIVWRLPLRLAHLAGGYLPLRSVVVDALRGAGSGQLAVRLELAHPGQGLTEAEATQHTRAELDDDTGRLLPVLWPPDFFPGLELRLRLPRGGRVIHATTMPLDTPVSVEGRVIGHVYDPSVLTREDAPGSSRTRDSAAGLDTDGLVMRAVRRCGFLAPDGHALLDRAVLPSTVYGAEYRRGRPATCPRDTLEAAVERHFASGSLYPALGSRDRDGHPHHPGRPGERVIPLVGYTPDPIALPRPAGEPEGPGRSRPMESVALHHVPGHVRRLLPGSSPSEGQRVAFREYCRQLGKADGWELPVGYTFVTPHTRGR
ncbi:hypothetical protein ACIBJC_03675 [Streptomyces sp. NPDC050509]|uniref:hypothetical protein n=1 Tax=Streptomyces sp. NPDC050509 TaxID=3365620 RepID=UPI00379B3862